MKIFMTTSCKTHDTVDSYALHLVSLMFENTTNFDKNGAENAGCIEHWIHESNAR